MKNYSHIVTFTTPKGDSFPFVYVETDDSLSQIDSELKAVDTVTNALVDASPDWLFDREGNTVDYVVKVEPLSVEKGLFQILPYKATPFDIEVEIVLEDNLDLLDECQLLKEGGLSYLGSQGDDGGERTRQLRRIRLQ